MDLRLINPSSSLALGNDYFIRLGLHFSPFSPQLNRICKLKMHTFIKVCKTHKVTLRTHKSVTLWLWAHCIRHAVLFTLENKLTE